MRLQKLASLVSLALLVLLPAPSLAHAADPNLILQLDFEGDNFTTANSDLYRTVNFSDKSNIPKRTDCQSQFTINGQNHNQCPTPGSDPSGNRSAIFSGALCDMGSDYLAVESSSPFQNLTNGSIAFWLSSADTTNITYRLLDAFKLSTAGSWQFHRDGDVYLTFTVSSDLHRELDLISFPAGRIPANTWNHYSLTWDGTNIRGYFNGVMIAQVPMSGITSFNLGNYLAIGAMMHGDPRNSSDGGNCVNQYAAPAGSYVFPNAGFFTGSLDDIRIYNRVLTPTEIGALSSAISSPTTDKILTVSKVGSGNGSVTGGGISCGKHCAESYAAGATVTLLPSAETGSEFTGWSGACSGTGSCQLALTDHRAVTATFNRSYTVVSDVAATSGTISGPFSIRPDAITQLTQITDPTISGRAAYNFSVTETANYIVALTVNAPSQSANSIFVNIDSEPTVDNTFHMTTTSSFEERLVSWGGSTSGGNPFKQFVLAAGTHQLILRGREANLEIAKITILKIPTNNQSTLTVLKDGTGSGTVTGTGIICGTDCAERVNNGTVVGLSASASPGSFFAGWSGGCSGTGGCSVTVNADSIRTATFTSGSAAKSWYVDSNVASSGNGTSWALAWKRFADITWASINPGDTIWISGGTYNEDPRVQKSGTSTAPITLKASQATGHNSKVIINGTLGAYGANYIVFDGAKSDTVKPSTTFEVKTLVPLNTNWKVRGMIFGTPGGGNGVTIRWMDIGDYYNGPVYSGIPANTFGVSWNNGDGWGNIVEYCFIHDTEDNGVEILTNTESSSFGDWVFRWNYLYHTGDDFIEGQPSMDIHNNYFDYEIQRHGHPDGVAGPMGRTRVYNNIMVDVWDQIIYLKIWERNPDNYGDVYIYGNLIYIDRGADTIKADGVQTAISIGWETGRTGVPTDNLLNKVVIANNTIVARGTFTPGDLRNMADFVNAYAPQNNGTYSNTVHLRNLMVKNNIFYNSPTNGLSLKGAAGSGFEFTEADVEVDNNVISSTVAAGNKITYLSATPYVNAEAFSAATRYKSNTSQRPTFLSESSHNYRLSQTDVVARDKGTELSSLNLPGLSHDLMGTPRGIGAGWDIGAFETPNDQVDQSPSPPSGLRVAE